MTLHSLSNPRSPTVDDREFAFLESLVDHVYQKLKELVTKEAIMPGAKLGHEYLSEVLKVSHTPIREALNRLVQEGYVKKVPRRGYYLREISVEEAEELYSFREIIESYTVDKAMASGDGLLVRDLREIMKRYGQEIRKGMSVERRRVDRAFHLRIAEAAGNQFVKKTLEQVFDQLILKRRLEGFLPRDREVYQEHEVLLECFEKRDKDKAKETVKAHIRKGRENFLKRYRPKQS
jgi:GntR family transcriptional regulator, rspAB operon transcriptional repressor